MKKTLRFTLLSMLMMLCGTMWGQEVTLSFATNDWSLPEGSDAGITGPSSYSNNDNYTITLEATTKFYYNTSDKYLLLGKSGSTLTLPAFNFDVESNPLFREIVRRE